jgi:orotidine-5'-phosphate decarboxylase
VTVPEIIVALDLPSAGEAMRLLDRIPAARWVKIGSVLFTRTGPSLVEECRRRGLEVFLDLKWHDIPNTVAGAVRSARDLGVAMATVHTTGGPAMLEAAREAAGDALAIVGVTILTSHDPATLGAAIGRTSPVIADEVARLARLAASAGLAGVVCSPQEVSIVRPSLGAGAFIVVPGIRRSSDAAGDQVRVGTPRDAARDGATHLVVGRPILQAGDPAAVLAELASEVG